MVAKRHSLRNIKNQDYGFMESGVIGVNVEMIWLETQKEGDFIAEFASTYAHELLHVFLSHFDIPELIEEEIIRAMLGEEWDDEIEAQYT